MFAKKIALIALAVLFLFSVSPGLAEIMILPIVNFRLSGGSSSFTGQNQDKASTSFNGDTNLDLVPVVRFNDHLSLLPRYSGYYTGVGTLKQLEDQDILYQQTIDQFFSLRLLYKFNPSLKFDTEYGRTKELARETKDEKWGTGLYNYQSNFILFGLEKRFSDFSIPFLIGGGLKFYTMRYPNYQSLASQANQAEQAGGINVLDTDNQEVFLNGDVLFGEESLLKWDITITQSKYLDKKSLLKWAETPVYSADQRLDNIVEINTRLNFPLTGEKEDLKTYWGLALGVKSKTTNESFGDTNVNKIIPKFYDYGQVSLIPSLSLKLLPGNFTISLDYEFSRRSYAHRITSLPHNAGEDFKYGVQANIGFLRIGFYYPLKAGLSLDSSVNFRTSASKADYQPEKYNYQSFNYLLGFSYEY